MLSLISTWLKLSFWLICCFGRWATWVQAGLIGKGKVLEHWCYLSWHWTKGRAICLVAEFAFVINWICILWQLLSLTICLVFVLLFVGFFPLVLMSSLTWEWLLEKATRSYALSKPVWDGLQRGIWGDTRPCSLRSNHYWPFLLFYSKLPGSLSPSGWLSHTDDSFTLCQIHVF